VSWITPSCSSSLIHPCTPASIDVYHRPLSRHVDHHGWSCTVILNPEKRMVGVDEQQRGCMELDGTDRLVSERLPQADAELAVAL
jgi:hypothetical protein